MRSTWRALWLAGGALAFGACANIFGLDQYEDASAQLCAKCEELPGCEAGLNEKLAAASDDQIAAWLELYEALGCAGSLCDQTTLECYYRAPDNQVKDGAPCLHSEGCEDFDFAAPTEGGGCCAGNEGDEGVCCAEGCITCEGKLTTFIQNGDSTAQLCRSHEASWDAVVACRGKQCGLKCKPPFLTQLAKDECIACVAKGCPAEVADCTKNQAR